MGLHLCTLHVASCDLNFSHGVNLTQHKFANLGLSQVQVKKSNTPQTYPWYPVSFNVVIKNIWKI